MEKIKLKKAMKLKQTLATYATQDETRQSASPKESMQFYTTYKFYSSVVLDIAVLFPGICSGSMLYVFWPVWTNKKTLNN